MNLNLRIWTCHQNQGLRCQWICKILNHTGIYVILFIILLIIFVIWLSFLAQEIKLGFGSFLPGHLHTGPEIQECQIGKFKVWNFALQVFCKKYGCAIFWFNRGNYWGQFWVVHCWCPGHPRIVLKHPCSLARTVLHLEWSVVWRLIFSVKKLVNEKANVLYSSTPAAQKCTLGNVSCNNCFKRTDG